MLSLFVSLSRHMYLGISPSLVRSFLEGRCVDRENCTPRETTTEPPANKLQ